MCQTGQIRSQRVSGNDRQQQREVAKAIKVAREMALIPYAQRVVTQRKGDRRRGRSDRDDARGDDSQLEEMRSEIDIDEYVESGNDGDVEEQVEEVTSE